MFQVKTMCNFVRVSLLATSFLREVEKNVALMKLFLYLSTFTQFVLLTFMCAFD